MSRRDKTVLVVDDEEALRTYAAKLIEKRGYQVVTAGDGAPPSRDRDQSNGSSLARSAGGRSPIR